MFCSKCHNDLADCTCPDIEERLAKLGKLSGGSLVYRMCAKCGNHYARCKCEVPVWTTSMDIAAPKEEEDAR